MSNEHKAPQSDKPKTRPVAFWMAIGAGIGAGVGVAFDNIAVGCVRYAWVTAIGAAQTQRNKKK